MDRHKEPLETKYYKLERLVKWSKIDEVNRQIVSGVSPRAVSEWCKDNGFIISHPKMYEYRDLLNESIAKHVTVERMLGIGVPKKSSHILQAIGVSPVRELVKSEMEVLDGIIQLGFDVLSDLPTIRLQDAMKAIELKNKLTGGTHGGLTNHGLDQLRELEQAKFSAVLEVVLSYLPEERHEEVYDAMVLAERTYYEESAPQFLDDYEKALEEEISTGDGTVVSNTRF